MPYAEYSDGVDDTCSTVIGGDSSREEKIVKTSEDIGHPHQQISQTNRRESRDIHGFSRAAASVFDDDPFFNDEKEQSGAKMSDFTSESRSWEDLIRINTDLNVKCTVHVVYIIFSNTALSWKKESSPYWCMIGKRGKCILIIAYETSLQLRKTARMFLTQ